ncbi:MAG TPA: choice-of-anchor J domain-containing protein, partial [Cyclobacteriaceae bacterium]|nr:choice-of-anchor J domain-containing protein [Cyclobacteriaceae bacterium]
GITPTIEIQNLGTNTVTSARLQVKVNGAIVETKDAVLNLANLEITQVSFNPVTQVSGTATYETEVLLVNGVADQRADNNLLSISSTVSTTATLPITEVFNSLPTSWSRSNPDNSVQWASKSTSSNGNSMYVNCYDYENQGAVDRLITPILDLTNKPVALLKFDRAYAVYSAANPERLRVLVSTVCDFNNSPDEVFNKAGSDLATAPQTTSQFSPNASQWVTETISLNQFIGSKIQIAFEVTNGWGNDVYLDNVVVLSDEFVDLALLSVESPGPVTCLANPAPVIRVKNLGSTTITSFKVQSTINNQAQAIQTISTISLTPGNEQAVTLNTISLGTTNNSISFTVSEPGGLPDANSNNNSISIKRISNNYAEVIPLRENFDEFYLDRWPVISQDNDALWAPFATNKLYSLAYSAYTNLSKGDESWVVSPVLDLSKTSKASLFFDVSYATQSQGNERLRILYSEDCGQTYPNVLYDQAGSSLSTTNTSLSWIPSQESDWRREFIDLSSLAGQDQIRIAFVATANNGNNLYVDEIEFFTDDNPFPIPINDLYSVYGVGSDVKLTFNLPEKQLVNLKIHTMLGQLILDNDLPETLNQTYSFDIRQQGTGIYIVRVQFGNQAGASKIFLTGN